MNPLSEGFYFAHVMVLWYNIIMKSKTIKDEVRSLRAKGMTYSQIKSYLNIPLPKSTISYWCRGVTKPAEYYQNLANIVGANLKRSRNLAVKAKNKKMQEYYRSIYEINKNIRGLLNDKKVVKLILSILYLAEGTKKHRSSLTFGNSDPGIIKFFLNLLRQSYAIDESKFRCTIQCRADQNIKKLEKFWSIQTGIPLSKFYKARIDSRTIGRVSRNKGYLGVCRLDYFSAHIFHELEIINQIILS